MALSSECSPQRKLKVCPVDRFRVRIKATCSPEGLQGQSVLRMLVTVEYHPDLRLLVPPKGIKSGATKRAFVMELFKPIMVGDST